MTDTITYYELHTCQTCADTNESPTPLQYAIEILGGSLTVGPAIHTNDEFSAGWHMGVEGTPYDPREDQTGLCPVSLAEPGDTQAWLIGFVAGRFAIENEWSTPTCIDPEMADHSGNPPASDD